MTPRWAGTWAGQSSAPTPSLDAVVAIAQLVGACAEFLVAHLRECAPRPSRLDVLESAAVPLAASTALQALRDVARVQRGARVLVHGASGGVGVFAIQLAKNVLGAHVTTTSGEANRALCLRLGADVALDYRATDPLAGGERFDVVFDVFGNRTFREARAALEPRGVYVKTVPKPRDFLAVARTLVGFPRARLVVVRPRSSDLSFIARCVDEGRIVPVVEQVYPLERIADAQEHVQTKHTRGKVVVRVS